MIAMMMIQVVCTLLLGGVVALLALYGVYLTRARETSVKRAGQIGLAVGLCCGASLVIVVSMMML